MLKKPTVWAIVAFVLLALIAGACGQAASPRVIEKEVVVEKPVVETVVVKEKVVVEKEVPVEIKVVKEVVVTATSAPEPFVLNVRFGWRKNFEFVYCFAADQLGYYAEEGLKVNFFRGGAGIDPITMVVADDDEQIGIASSGGQLMIARSRGRPVKAFAAFYQFHPNGFLVLDESPIKSIKDFAGKRIGIQAEGTHYLQALAAAHGVNYQDMEVVHVGYDPTQLIIGEIDAYMAWSVNQPYAVEKAGEDWRFLYLADTPGLRFYAMVAFTTDKFLEEHPEVVEGFLRATLRGMEYILANPEEAARITVMDQYCRGCDYEGQIWGLKQANLLSVSEDTKTYSLGWMDPTVWELGRDTLFDLGQMDEKPAVDEFMTLDVLRKVHTK